MPLLLVSCPISMGFQDKLPTMSASKNRAMVGRSTPAARCAEEKASMKAARRAKMKALMSSSLRLSKEQGDGELFTCSKCFLVFGSEASLQNHVSTHINSQTLTVCEFCGKVTDIETQRFQSVKRVRIDHGRREGQPGAVVVEFVRVPIQMGHDCNESLKKRPVDDDGYRSSKK